MELELQLALAQKPLTLELEISHSDGRNGFPTKHQIECLTKAINYALAYKQIAHIIVIDENRGYAPNIKSLIDYFQLVIKKFESPNEKLELRYESIDEKDHGGYSRLNIITISHSAVPTIEENTANKE